MIIVWKLTVSLQDWKVLIWRLPTMDHRAASIDFDDFENTAAGLDLTKFYDCGFIGQWLRI